VVAQLVDRARRYLHDRRGGVLAAHAVEDELDRTVEDLEGLVLGCRRSRERGRAPG
jgi:hypothetical protein